MVVLPLAFCTINFTFFFICLKTIGQNPFDVHLYVVHIHLLQVPPPPLPLFYPPFFCANRVFQVIFSFLGGYFGACINNDHFFKVTKHERLRVIL